METLLKYKTLTNNLNKFTVRTIMKTHLNLLLKCANSVSYLGIKDLAIETCIHTNNPLTLNNLTEKMKGWITEGNDLMKYTK